MLPLWTSLFFCEIGTHTHRGNHSLFFSSGCRYLFPLAHLLEARLVFAGRSPLGYDVVLYLFCLALSCAPFFSADLFWAPRETVFLRFCCVLGRFVRLWEACSQSDHMLRGSTWKIKLFAFNNIQVKQGDNSCKVKQQLVETCSGNSS